ncbi:MAG TPA: NrfD/PsrC family molybdoenzyme membrane anchor subunit [Polyangiales bacterium]
MMRWWQETERVIGRAGSRACLAAIVAGLVALGWGATGANAQGVFGALIASWLFFAGVAMGAVAFRALLSVMHARWSVPLDPAAARATAFMPAAAALLAIIVVAFRLWAPWAEHANPARAFWLNAPFFSIRELVATAALFGMAHHGFRTARDPSSKQQRPIAFAVAFCMVYCVVLSIWAIDFVLGVDRDWVSSLIGPHLFVGALYSGIALVTLLSLAAGSVGEFQRAALTKLMVAFSILWIYMFWSQYLPIWYGNLPDEIGFVLERSAQPWRALYLVVVATTFVAPFVLLLHPSSRRSRKVLAAVCVGVLAGLWLERIVLVMPSLHVAGTPVLDPRALFVAAGVLGAFVLTVGRSRRLVA